MLNKIQIAEYEQMIGRVFSSLLLLVLIVIGKPKGAML